MIETVKCSNKECNGNPLEHQNRIIVNENGNMVCDKACYILYERQQFYKQYHKESNENIEEKIQTVKN